MKKIDFMLTAFRDGFQSVFGARVFSKDYLPLVEYASKECGIKHLEAGGGALFQSAFFYTKENAFDVMDAFRKAAGPDAELQTLARGMTQGVTTLGYAAIRGFGPSHPTVGELRAGSIDVLIDNPLSEDHKEEDAYFVGSIPVTEVESVFSVDSTEGGKAHLSFEVGYGLVMGNLETKAIAMSVLEQLSLLNQEQAVALARFKVKDNLNCRNEVIGSVYPAFKLQKAD